MPRFEARTDDGSVFLSFHRYIDAHEWARALSRAGQRVTVIHAPMGQQSRIIEVFEDGRETEGGGSMSERNDGGPAFAHGNPDQGGDSGMSLRDYFAASVSNDDHVIRAVRTMDDRDLARYALGTDDEETVSDAADYMGLSELEKTEKRLALEAKAIARARYQQADAMLAEREK